MIRFLPVVVIGSRSLAYQEAADAGSQAREGLPLRPLAFLPPLPWNDLVESPFRLGRVAWRYTPRIRQCVARCRLIACVQVLSPPFPQSSSASRFTAGAPTFFILSQSGERPERYVESFRFDTILQAPSRGH